MVCADVACKVCGVRAAVRPVKREGRWPDAGAELRALWPMQSALSWRYGLRDYIRRCLPPAVPVVAEQSARCHAGICAARRLRLPGSPGQNAFG